MLKFRFLFQKFSKLSSKLIFVYIAIILLLTLVMSAFFAVSYSQVAKKELMDKNVSLLSVYYDNLSLYLKQLSDFSLECRRDNTIMNILNGDEQSSYERQSVLSSFLTSAFFSRTDISEMTVYIPRCQELYQISSKGNNKSAFIRKDSNYEQSVWYQKLQQSKTFSYIEPVSAQNASQKDFLIYHRSIIDIETQSILATISFVMEYDYFENLFYNQTFENEIFSLYDGKKQLYFTSDRQQTEKMCQTDAWWNLIETNKDLSGSMSFDFENQSYQLIYYRGEDWILVRTIPHRELIQPIGEIIWLIFLFSIFLLLIIIPVIILLSRTITKPLRELSDKMDQIRLDHFELIPENHQNDETAQLLKHFNAMMLRLNQLIESEYKADLAMKTAQIKAIEAQLNPHFLYNTLQTISTKALIGNMPEISDMIDMLAMNFRYTIRSGTVVMIRDELRFVQNYVALQKARFNDRLTVVYHVDDSLIDHVLIPKLALQIPIENAIIHGMENSSKGITITVSINQIQNKIELVIHNDGLTISQQTLAHLHMELNRTQYDFQPSNGGIGLINLNACLHWIYGEESCMTILSDSDHGTVVKLEIPIRKKGDDKNVHDDDC